MGKILPSLIYTSLFFQCPSSVKIILLLKASTWPAVGEIEHSPPTPPSSGSSWVEGIISTWWTLSLRGDWITKVLTWCFNGIIERCWTTSRDLLEEEVFIWCVLFFAPSATLLLDHCNTSSFCMLPLHWYPLCHALAQTDGYRQISTKNLGNHEPK